MFRLMLMLFLLLCLLTGCRLTAQEDTAVDPLQAPALDSATSAADPFANTPAPTVALLFRAEATATPTPTVQQGRVLIPTVVPTTKAGVRTTGSDSASLQLPYAERVIYNDELNAGWTMEHSTNTTFNPWDTTHWFQTLRQETTSGASAIAVSPQADYGTLFFAVRPDSDTVYKRTEVLGVSFWLNSGSDGIATADLAVTVLGSNKVPYWEADDRSVFGDNPGAFSETRLYYLDINRTIPPNTWINIVVWLNKLQFDPPYTYVTGFYVKNDLDFRSTYYLDQVALLVMP